MPLMPPASAVRTSAPTLPGSCTSIATSTSAFDTEQTSLADAGRRVAIAMRPDGVRTGLIAAKTASGACTTSTPELSSICATRPSSVSDAIRDAETAASSKEWPDSCASRTRCTPSRSTRAPVESAESASERNRVTVGFCRLVMERINWLVDRGEPPSIIVLQSDFNDERQNSQAIQR